MAMGRPRKEINLEQLKVLCRLMCTLKDCADYFECGETTISEKIKKEAGLTFREFRAQSMVETRLELRRTALRRAKDGSDTMLIFSLKNLDGWRDKIEQDVVVSDSRLVIDMDDDDKKES